MRGHRDLALASAAAIACAALATVLPWEGARLVVALPLAFFLPGYAIVAASFGPRRLPQAQVIMLSLGCSLAVLALGALVLNYVPGGIQTASWAILLAVVVVAACRGAAIGRPAPEEAPPTERIPRPRRVDVLCGVVVVALAAGAIGLANTPLPAGDAAGYSALWMLPAGAADHAARLGVSNSEQGPRRYELKLQVGSRPATIVSRFGLRPGDERIFTVPVPASRHRSVRVTGLLFRGSDPVAAYRKVRTWLPPRGR